MNTKPTQEQVEQAIVTIQNGEAVAYEDDIYIERDEIQAIRVLLVAVPALSADLEAERAAHAETRLELESSRDQVAEWQEAAGGRTFEAFTSQLDAWQRATGCQTPEEYQRRAEPTDEQVERLANVYSSATMQEAAGDEPENDTVAAYTRRLDRAGIRAVLRSLPAPTLPSEEEIRALGIPLGRTEEETGVRIESAVEYAYTCDGCGGWAANHDDPCNNKTCPSFVARAVLDLMRERGASDPPSDEQLAEEARCCEDWDAFAGKSERKIWAAAYSKGARREGRR